jgi:hypothetical protein
MSGNFNKKKANVKFDAALAEKRNKTLSGSRENFRVSFEHLDTSQKFGSSFKDGQSCGLLSKMLETLQGYCKSPLETQLDDKFTIYGDFPSKIKQCSSIRRIFLKMQNGPEYM